MHNLKRRIRAKFHRHNSADDSDIPTQSAPERLLGSSLRIPSSPFWRSSEGASNVSLDSVPRYQGAEPEPDPEPHPHPLAQPQGGPLSATANLDDRDRDTLASTSLPSSLPTTSSPSSPATNTPLEQEEGEKRIYDTENQEPENLEQVENQEPGVHPEQLENRASDEPIDDLEPGNGIQMSVNPSEGSRPREGERRQSLLPTQQTALIKTLLEFGKAANLESGRGEQSSAGGQSTINGSMLTRKIWVKRPNSSATLVTINEEDLVDDVRDMILRKYANSLGRNFDAPDVTLRICPRSDHARDNSRDHGREHRNERILGPEEPISRTIDANFPGGQTVHEALIIDVPVRPTPRQSPRATLYYHDEIRPSESGTDYFPPMPVTLVPSPHHQGGASVPASASSSIPHSMSVLSTGHIPNLPSPGRKYGARPRVPRVTSSSPPVINGQQTPVSAGANGRTASPHGARSRAHPVLAEHSKTPPTPKPPTPPEIEPIAPGVVAPPPRDSSPVPSSRAKKPKRLMRNLPSMPGGMLNGASVPPINVLIVEDNIINLKLLEAFMKRLKVRWQTAMDGKDAMTKWRQGGFHLVLMDIQLPVMNGLEATREIRRLERLNGIGVFSSASSTAPEKPEEPEGEDKLPTPILFKSPVIIVALTASSLQSDRHEALASGCNDFLTKPVNFVWLERKVMEWGCMQALIDFDGWRKWKDFSAQEVQPANGKADAPPKKNSGGGGKGKGKKSRLGAAREAVATSATIREEE
ncbi:hypothetical protein V496_01530 [Pseudogymnoascus sp. VKM F-4515 (FW-2607)]|nr:hypothetical protein V496_01530 [Pseudogymnoascus sp. VKM F-4515 (FW-2607)]